MTAITSILAATDLSAPARHAAERAASLARAAPARLEVLHVLRPSGFEELRALLVGGDDPEAMLLGQARGELDQQAGALGARFGIDVVRSVVCGNPVTEITDRAERSGADLIVTGTRGAGLVRSLTLGSTAERIAMRSRRPVLLVRQAPHEAYRRVLVPVDFSPWTAGSVELARAVAPGAKLLLMHAVEVPFEGRLRLAGIPDGVIHGVRVEAGRRALSEIHMLAARLGLARHAYEALVTDALDVWMQIVQQEQELDCDLIAIGKHGRDAVTELLLGTTTRMVVARSAADVLVSTQADPRQP